MILLLGASGCTGSYLLETLLSQTDAKIIAWVRDPRKLRQSAHSRLQIWPGGLEQLEAYRSQLGKVSTLIHAATAWGGPETFAINDRQSWRLLQALDPAVCRQVHLFSTASLLDQRHRFWPQAHRLGTDYIRSKAALHQRLSQSVLPISVYYPTVILGGDAGHPYTAVSAALPNLPRWLPWARWLRAQGWLHLIHARDIARIVVHRLQQNSPPERLVLGNPAISVNQLIATLTALEGLPRPRHQLPLEPLLPLLVELLQTQMSPWDRFSLYHRDIVYNSVHAATYGLPADLTSLAAMVSHGRQASAFTAQSA